MKELFAFGQVPEPGVVLTKAAVEDGNGDPPEDDRHGEEDRGLGACEGGVLAAISSWKVLERQGKKSDGDDEEDVEGGVG